MAEIGQSLPPKNQAIKNLIYERFNGNVSAFCRELDMSDTAKINRLFTIDKRNGKYPTPSTDILELISNKLRISLDELLGINVINYNGGNNFRSTTNIHSKDDSQSSMVDKLMLELAEQRKMMQKSQEQVDRLLSLLEQTHKK